MLSKPIEETLKKMEKYESQFGSQFAVGERTGMFLHDFVLKNKPKLILELGTWRGASAIYLAAALQELGAGKVVTLDKSQANFETARQNIASAGLERYAECHLVDVDDFFQTNRQKVDFVFMDAAKSKQAAWVEALLNGHLNARAAIVIDDVDKLGYKMDDLFQFLQKHPEIKATHHAIGNGLLELQGA